MMPHDIAWQRYLVAASWLTVSLANGCTAPLFRGQSPEPKPVTQFVDERPGSTKFIGDLASAIGTNDLKVESVALVTQLDATGSDPPPSPLRDQLIKEMQTHNVRRPEEALSSKNTAMVVVTGYIPPGAKKGDTFDVSVRIAPRTDTSSLRNGWLMATRLREHAVVDNSVHSGHVAALAQGPILCDALFDKSQDSVLQVRGRVLGGGAVQLERPLGLMIHSEHTSIKTSAMIGAAINDRFHDFDRGTKRGLANPTTDTFIELKIHSRYRDNVARFIQVVRSIAVSEPQIERLARLQELEGQLLEPTTSQRAALQLEAIGKEAIPTLHRGLNASDPEIRFYSAEALAYLDDTEASDALFEAARTERAFRWRSMLALAVMDQYASQEALIELMNAPSAETRYGAFRALRSHNPTDPLVRGETLNDEFAFHVLRSTGEPMIHISRSRRPEIVLFGQNQKLESPSFVFAGKIVVIRHNEQMVKVKKFSADGEDKVEICSNDLAEVVRTIAKLGGSYADVMQALSEAKTKGFLAGRLEVDALPRPGRVYHRDEDEATGSSVTMQPDSPEVIPAIFQDRLRNDHERVEKESVEDELDLTPTPPKERGWLDRMTGWMVE